MAVHNHDSESINLLDGWTNLKIKKEKECENMNENVKTEIEKSLQYIGMTQEEAEQKYGEICAENGVETTDSFGKALWRSFVSQHQRSKAQTKQDDGSLTKTVFGFFVTLDAPRDMMAWKRRTAGEEYRRDADAALENGIVAIATENALGKWVVSRTHKGTYEEKVVSNLPSGAEEGIDGQYFIPLDNTERYMNGGENKAYGKPLPVEQFRRQGMFYGSVGGGENQMWAFSYKNQPGVDFQPNTFDWVTFLAIPNQERGALYGMTEVTKASLVRNSDVDPESEHYRDMSSFDFENFIMNDLSENLVPLHELDRKHEEFQSRDYGSRFVVTDGVVCNMNMTATKNGNRILNITDLDAEFDYEEGSGVVTCWIPEHIEIDFGIGSAVVVIGRSSRRVVDGETEPATINVGGLYAIEKRGSVVETPQAIEEDFDWF
jgi:hypothetical protein